MGTLNEIDVTLKVMFQGKAHSWKEKVLFLMMVTKHEMVG